MIIKGTQNYENFWKWRSNLTVYTQAAYNRLLLTATLLVINLWFFISVKLQIRLALHLPALAEPGVSKLIQVQYVFY